MPCFPPAKDVLDHPDHLGRSILPIQTQRVDQRAITRRLHGLQHKRDDNSLLSVRVAQQSQLEFPLAKLGAKVVLAIHSEKNAARPDRASAA